MPLQFLTKKQQNRERGQSFLKLPQMTYKKLE